MQMLRAISIMGIQTVLFVVVVVIKWLVIGGEQLSRGGKCNCRRLVGAKGSAIALQNFGGRTSNELIAAAGEPINKEGLTKAARALTKDAQCGGHKDGADQ